MQLIGLLTIAIGCLILWFQIEVILTERAAGGITVLDSRLWFVIKVWRLQQTYRLQSWFAKYHPLDALFEGVFDNPFLVVRR